MYMTSRLIHSFQGIFEGLAQLHRLAAFPHILFLHRWRAANSKTSTEGNVFSRFLVALALAWTSLHAQAVPPSQTSQPVNAVIEWNRTLLTIVRTPGAQPATLHSTRSYAILHAAIFDAVNSADRSFAPHFAQPSHITRRASPSAAAHQAAHDVLVALYPTFQTTLDSELQQDLDQIPDGKSKT